MRKILAALAVGTALTGGLIACSKKAEQAKLKADFDHICASQKDFLSARKLKGVDEAELLVERMRRMREGLSMETAIETADQLTQTTSYEMRSLAEKAAAEAGLAGWACPELAASR
jgi:hypothetical protein